MRVLGIDPRVTELPPGMSDLATPDRLGERLGEADFVILTTPEAPDTVGMFNARLFARMNITTEHRLGPRFLGLIKRVRTVTHREAKVATIRRQA